ncbi:MAG: LCP family protein [Treponema sp.]|uniref:LCP family protein n=1 Tax=Treponema sp. TaxID=166 RepID=UPI00298DD361|nr:LCP family protein [Treponema sp.]MBR5932625.1 LCP family protein [Treponema sp.]
MRTKSEQKSLILVGLILAIVAAVITVIMLSVKHDTVKENLKQDPVIKVLFVLEDKNQALFTDVLIYYPVTGKGVLANIPGNTGGLHRSIDRVDRIDAIYSELGVEQYCSEIADFIDVDIPFHITVSMKNFIEMSDLLGGLEIFIPVSVDLESPVGEKWLLPSGRVTLDGDKIKTFMTYFEDDDSDKFIQERRQDAVVAFFSALKLNANTFLTKKHFDQIASRISFNGKTQDLFELLTYISQVDTERFEYITVTGKENTVDGKTLLMPFRNGEYIKDVVKKAINSVVSPSGTANARPYILRILNGTKVQGLAHNTQILLQGAAFEVLDIANAKTEDEIEETYIIDHIGQPEIAKSIGDFIHCTKIEEEAIKEGDEENVSNVDFTLVLGKNFDGRWVHDKKKEN